MTSSGKKEYDPVTFSRWSDIEQLHNLVNSVKKSKSQFETTQTPIEPFQHAFDKTIAYKSKVKLHGSNAGVTIQKEGLRPQSRNQFLDETGFGKLIYDNYNYYKSLFDGKHSKVVIFGEFAGKGVQPKVALAQLPFTIFAIFAVQLGEDHLMVEPDHIQAFLTKNNTVELPKNTYVLPWFPAEQEFVLNLTDGEAMAPIVEKINQVVDVIDKEDPWVKHHFGKNGPGEGLVLYPMTFADPETKFLPMALFSEFVFKAKGSSHQNVKTQKAAQVVPEKASGVEDFVNLMVTEPRLEQGVKEACNGDFNSKLTLQFVNWVRGDVQKEGNDELEASGLTWEKVVGAINKKASSWYSQQVKSHATK